MALFIRELGNWGICGFIFFDDTNKLSIRLKTYCLYVPNILDPWKPKQNRVIHQGVLSIGQVQFNLLFRSGPPEHIWTWWGQIFFKIDSLASSDLALLFNRIAFSVEYVWLVLWIEFHRIQQNSIQELQILNFKNFCTN